MKKDFAVVYWEKKSSII